jgi:GT2 family glycosyltransferase
VSEPTREQARELNAGVVSLLERLLEKHTFAVLQVVREEIAARDARLVAVRAEVEAVRRFHFAHNPPNTGLAAGFNSILDVIDSKSASPMTEGVEP